MLFFAILTDRSTKQTYRGIQNTDRIIYENKKKELLRVYPHPGADDYDDDEYTLI